MKLYKPILLFLVVFVLSHNCKAEKSFDKRPNVIVIITDDQGYGDLGVYGGNDLKTAFPTLQEPPSPDQTEPSVPEISEPV